MVILPSFFIRTSCQQLMPWSRPLFKKDIAGIVSPQLKTPPSTRLAFRLALLARAANCLCVFSHPLDS